jgi:hypothetical protein
MIPSHSKELSFAALALGIDYFYCKVDPLYKLLAILADCDGRMEYNISTCRLPILRS